MDDGFADSSDDFKPQPTPVEVQVRPVVQVYFQIENLGAG